MRVIFRSSFLPLLFAAACGGQAIDPASPSPDASSDAGSGDEPSTGPACDPSACLATTIVVTGFYRGQTLSPCNAFSSYEYNKGLGRSFTCSAMLPACGDASVDAVNRALADPDVVAALQSTSSSFVDPTFPMSASGQFEFGTEPPGVILPPSDGGPHDIFVTNTSSACGQAPCTPAPAGIVRLAHLLAGLETLCVPVEN
jgi:hypothetical protein